MKYRRLSTSELGELEQEFVKFLASNSIEGKDWEKLKINQPEKVSGLLDVFSDIVWEKTLPRIKSLEEKSPYRWSVYLFDKSEAELISVEIDHGAVHLDDPHFISKVAQKEIQWEALNPVFFHGKKTYSEDREREIYTKMEEGAKPCSEVVFMGLKKLSQA